MSVSENAEFDSSIKIYFSTVVRGAPQRNGGEVVLIDWNKKNVEVRQPVFPSNPDLVDPNPRGNARGGRGIEFIEDDVIVANYHTLKIYDRNLRHKKDVSHPLFVGLHETFSNGNGQIWVSSTSIDAILGMDINNNRVFQQYWPREMSYFQRELNLTPLDIDKEDDNRTKFLEKRHSRHPSHLHLNAIANWQGELYGLFNSFGVIANLDKEKIVIRDASLRHPHNLIIDENGTAIVNNTYKYAIHFYDLNDGKLLRTINLTEFELVRRLLLKDQLKYYFRGLLKKFFAFQINAPRPVFLRGLDQVGHYLFVGVSPATVLCIDSQSGKLLDYFSYTDDVNVCIHGLRVLVET
jgi:hypothetical protein